MPAPSELRRRVFHLVISVVVLDVIAIGAYMVGHVSTRSTRVQTGFVVAWMVVTLALVLTGLGRVRAVRGRRGIRG